MTLSSVRQSTRDGWLAEVRHDAAAWSAIAAEWEDLYARCSASNPFVTHSWLSSWWRHYGRGRPLVLVLVRRHGRLVAAAALVRRRRLGLPVLAPVGEVTSDLSDVLIDDEWADEAAPRLARAIRTAAGRRTVDLGGLPEEAAAWRLVKAWPGSVHRTRGALCLEIGVRPVPELIAALPGKTARRLRNKQRTVDATGVRTRWLEPAEARLGVADLLRLHREQWRGRAMNPEHRRARFARHLADAAAGMVDRGQAAIAEYRVDDRVVAVDLLLVGQRFVGGYLYGIHPTLKAQCNTTLLLLHAGIDLALRRERPVFSWLRGDEPHKRVWRPTEKYNQRVLLVGTRTVAGRLYAWAVRQRVRLSDTVHTRLARLRPVIARMRAWRPFST